MTRKDLLSSPGYWEEKVQNDLCNEIQNYLDKEGLSRTQLAEKLNVTKSYISQVMNGNTDHRISKLIDLSLCIGRVPLIQYKSLNRVIYEDELNLCPAFKQPYQMLKTFTTMNLNETFINDKTETIIPGHTNYKRFVKSEMFSK